MSTLYRMWSKNKNFTVHVFIDNSFDGDAVTEYQLFFYLWNDVQIYQYHEFSKG